MLIFLISTVFATPTLSGQTCATLEQLAIAPPAVRQEDLPVLHKNGKQERDAVCASCSNELYSDNFVVKWGSGVSQNEAQNILTAMEVAWDSEINDLGYLPPVGTDQYYFNVYIGDTGSGTPDGYGAAGYFTQDSEGFPMIVIAKTTAQSEYLDMTAAHEFFHAIQGRAARYDYDPTGPSAWFWEATANWAEGRVYPGTSNMAGFLMGYAFFPHYPVNYFNYPDSGSLDEFHQYGAFIFPLHITEIEADDSVIWNAWNDSGSDSDPMEVMDGYLREYGTTINESWLNHIAHMSVWDYALGSDYEYYIDYYQQYYPEGENRIARTVQQQGSAGWRSGPSDLEPQRYGHNTILAKSLSLSEASFGIRGAELGTMG